MNFQSVLLVFSTIMLTNRLGSASELSNSEAVRTVSNGLNQFATNFYTEVAAADGSVDNIVCSAISASIVLSMLTHGAAGNTETEMRTCLHLPNDRAMGLEGFRSLIDCFNEVKNVKLSVANKVYIDHSFTVKQEFKNLVANYFRSEVQNLQFSNYEEACRTINTWCEEKTNHLIKDVLQPDDLRDAIMVLVNAVYFKGLWRKKFDPQATINKPFYYNAQVTDNEVPMMTQLSKFNYGELPALDAVYVELPYQSQNENDSTSMFVICPREITGLKKAQENINTVDFKQLHDQKELTKIKLFLPKFKIENTFNLKTVLSKMGMQSMFMNSNFSGVSDTSISVSKVIQKAFIEVNEEGTEAAAVTVVALGRTAMNLRPDPIEVKVDRPFIYAIYHAPTNTILFQGHIVKLPTQST